MDRQLHAVLYSSRKTHQNLTKKLEFVLTSSKPSPFWSPKPLSIIVEISFESPSLVRISLKSTPFTLSFRRLDLNEERKDLSFFTMYALSSLYVMLHYIHRHFKHAAFVCIRVWQGNDQKA